MYKIYNIKYLEPIQYGGDIITYVPEYPMNLGESRSAEWPPSINEKVNVKDPESKKNYSGIVIDNIWNETASVVKLQEQDYTELSFKDEPKYNRWSLSRYLLAPLFPSPPSHTRPPLAYPPVSLQQPMRRHILAPRARTSSSSAGDRLSFA